MNRKATFIAAAILLAVSMNCHAQKKPVERHSFPFADENGEFVLEVEVSEGQPRTDINMGTKIIEVKKEGMLIRAEGFIPRRLRRNKGDETRLQLPYENTIPRCLRRGMVIGRMESIRLDDFDIGEGFQCIEKENNLLCIQQSTGGGRTIAIIILRFAYSDGKMLLDNVEVGRVDRIAEVQDFEWNKMSIQGPLDMNEIDDEAIHELLRI